MTNEELLKERLTVIAQIMTEWSEEDLKSHKSWEDKDYKGLSQWYKGKSEAYKMAADWILETIKYTR